MCKYQIKHLWKKENTSSHHLREYCESEIQSIKETLIWHRFSQAVFCDFTVTFILSFPMLFSFFLLFFFPELLCVKTIT